MDVLDVRKPTEFAGSHINGAINLPLDYINEEMDQVDDSKHYFIHCAGGYRSMIFSSILKSRGYHDLVDVAGGFGAISKTGIPLATEEELA